MSEEVPIEHQSGHMSDDSDISVLTGSEALGAVPGEFDNDRTTTAGEPNQHTKNLQEEQEKKEQERKEIDSRSVYVGNVDYATTPLELQQHFSSAGVVNRVTILTNKLTGSPKGYAYVEFTSSGAVEAAILTLDGSKFRDRELRVSAKRSNIPGLGTGLRGGGGRSSFRGGRGGRGGPRGRGRGRASFRGGNRFSPY